MDFISNFNIPNYQEEWAFWDKNQGNQDELITGCFQPITNNVINFQNFKFSQYLSAADIYDETHIVNSDAGNFKSILITNEVYNLLFNTSQLK